RCEGSQRNRQRSETNANGGLRLTRSVWNLAELADRRLRLCVLSGACLRAGQVTHQEQVLTSSAVYGIQRRGERPFNTLEVVLGGGEVRKTQSRGDHVRQGRCPLVLQRLR